MISNSPNRWDDPVTHKPKTGLDTAISLGGRFLALPKGTKIAIAVTAVLLFTLGFGTVLGWAFSLLAFLGRLILLGLVVVAVAMLVNMMKKR